VHTKETVTTEETRKTNIQSRKTTRLEDLELPVEQAEQAKAGTSTSARGGGGAGKVAFQDLHFTTS
jgi:hypothetical protein